eukprot:g15874.t1
MVPVGHVNTYNPFVANSKNPDPFSFSYTDVSQFLYSALAHVLTTLLGSVSIDRSPRLSYETTFPRRLDGCPTAKDVSRTAGNFLLTPGRLLDLPAAPSISGMGAAFPQ